MAAGNVSSAIAVPTVYVWSSTVRSPNVGAVSTSTSTVTANVNVAGSPSASVAVRVYGVAGCASVGVPLSVPPCASSTVGGV